MKPNDDYKDYERTFIRFSDKVENLIKKLLFGLIVCLVAAQCLMQYSQVRQWISRVDPLEGEPFQFGEDSRSK